MRLKIPNYNFAYSHKEVSLTEGVQDGQEALIIEHMIHLFAKPDVSFQISVFKLILSEEDSVIGCLHS